MTEIHNWDLNFWNENDGSVIGLEDIWRVTAYPFDQNNECIGGHSIFTSLELYEDEVDLMRLGWEDNYYDSGYDVWIGLDAINNYPHAIPDRIMEWLSELPTDIKCLL